MRCKYMYILLHPVSGPGHDSCLRRIVFAFSHPFAEANCSSEMCPRNPGGDSKAPPVAAPTPVAFPPVAAPTPEASAPPPHFGAPGPPQIHYVGTPVPGTNVGVWTTGLFGCFDDPSNCNSLFPKGKFHRSLILLFVNCVMSYIMPMMFFARDIGNRFSV